MKSLFSLHAQGDFFCGFVVKFLTFSSSDDDSDDQPCLDVQTYLMNEVGLVESALYELTHEHQLGVKVCWINFC